MFRVFDKESVIGDFFDVIKMSDIDHYGEIDEEPQKAKNHGHKLIINIILLMKKHLILD